MTKTNFLYGLVLHLLVFLAIPLQAQTIRGRVFLDNNNDCFPQVSEMGRIDFRVEALDTAQNLLFTTFTNANGDYDMSVDSGDYFVRVFPLTHRDTILCPNNVLTSVLLPAEIDTVNFGVRNLIDCPLLTVDIETALLEPCVATAPYQVSYCNYGIDTAFSTYIEVELPDVMRLDSALVPFVALGNNRFRFDRGNALPNFCEDFLFYITLDSSCMETTIQQTFCTRVHIYPDETACTGDFWAGAIAVPTIRCEADTVVFRIDNEGLAGMPQPLGYTVIEDNAILNTGPYTLPTVDDSLVIRLPYNDSSFYRIEVQQDTFAAQQPHLLDRIQWAFTEGCNEPVGSIKTGFAMQHYTDDSRHSIAIDCRESFPVQDSLTIYAAPVGYESQHCVDVRDRIDYSFFFKYGGTANTFVQIEGWDTLSPYLDPYSFKWESSENMTSWEILGNNILHFYIQTDLVPASQNNALASTWVNYSLKPYKETPEGTVIHKKLSYKLNGNAIETTDNIFHTICKDFIPPVITAQPYVEMPDYTVRIYPNPFQIGTTFDCIDGAFNQISLEIFDLAGRLLERQQSNGSQLYYTRGNLPAGLYLYRLYGDGQILNIGKIIAE